MNTRYYFLIVLWAMSLFAPLHAQTYDKLWKEVERPSSVCGVRIDENL